MNNYKHKIESEYITLSKGMKKVASYLLANPETFAMQSAAQVGKEVEVSETTVIRFCYALDYSGYSELQKEVRTHLLNTKSSLHSFQVDKEDIGDEPQFYLQAMKKDQGKIQRMIDQINDEDIHRVVKKIIESEQILVSGLRTSYALAQWFSFTLNVVRGNTKLFHPGTDDLIQLLSNMNEKSTFIAFSFHRYAKETIKLAEVVKRQGGSVIAITDSIVAPITEHADYHIPIQLQGQSTLDHGPAVFSLMNAIIAGVTVHDRERFEQRKQKYEALQLDDFFSS
ncbi:MurR/RpiR family transcriptional regulator [Bacillus sp. FJAT-45350]|uniref:MurR/RpiR family transcriptional regulator n=1 Tax=Bacillus sp. FJAT-45350 TaxID=2011014 RepID=UPI000BB69760|nr:MurR/RpiR family transcriptional regulator [Bacillus sp. FJAT-45350]